MREVRVLVADDNEDHRFLTSYALRRGTPGVSVHVDGVSDGTQALDYLYRRGEHVEQQRPDLVLLDLSLPGAHGLDVLRTLKQDGDLSPIPVVVLTSSDRPEDVRAAYAGGANSFVTKSRDLAPLVRYWTETVTLLEASW